MRSFNSTLVRLKVQRTILVMSFVVMFQFHIGAIKSGHWLCYPEEIPFQFHIGAIKSYKIGEKETEWYKVSIPHWCD